MIRLTLAAAAALLAVSAHAQLTAPPGVMQPPPGSAPVAPAPAPAPSAPSQQQDPMTPEFRDCVKKTKEAMEAKKQEDFPAILGCLSGETKRQEGRMARFVTKAGASLNAGEKKMLDEANTAWRRFRDANCNFYADPKGAPPISLENADCLLNLTVGRAQEMEMLSVQAARRAEARGPAKK